MEWIGLYNYKSVNYILAIAEYLALWCDATTNRVASALLQHVVFSHGFPQLLSDKGSQFQNEIIKILVQSFGIEQLFTSLYHPQTNGLTKRMNKTIEQVPRSDSGVDRVI